MTTTPPVLHSRLLILAGSSEPALHALERAESVWLADQRWPLDDPLVQALYRWHEWQDRYDACRSVPGSSLDADVKLADALIGWMYGRPACPACLAVERDVSVDDVRPVEEPGALACTTHRRTVCQRCLRLGWVVVDVQWMRDGEGYCGDCNEAARRRALRG